MAREEGTRAIIFSLSVLIITVIGSVGVAYAANGWVFGDLLNKILASGDWQTDTVGTVKNAQKLWGKDPSEYIRLASDPAKRSCAADKCVIGFNTDGSVKCTP